MSKINRREFLELSSKFAALFGLGVTAIPSIANALEEMAGGRLPVLWLQGQSCSGCSVSAINSSNPGIAQVLTKYISLKFHSTLSTATGKVGMKVIDDVVKAGDYFLVVEGSVPVKMPKACVVGHRPFVDMMRESAKNAKAIIPIGACASYGGIPAAENNPTGAVSIPKFLKDEGINKPTIVIPGCPVHPDWLVGTIVHVQKFGLPALDKYNRPKAFFSKKLHDQCQRFADYEREKFAKTFSEDGCLFKLGCTGPITYADCTVRNWNSNINNCIKAGAPCIGCAGEHFALNKSFPFYTKPGSQKREDV